jgi:hypothetical protein
VKVELSADEHRRLQIEKERTGLSLGALLRQYAGPHLDKLPAKPGRRRIES